MATVTLSPAVVIAVAAVMGLCVGSFLNVVIWRVPLGMSVNRPASHCVHCRQQLAWWQNVPILSWVGLRGRCHRCAARISARYPAVEAGCAALFVAVALARDGADAVPYCIAAAGMLALSIIDLDHHRLPDVVLVPTVALTAGGFGVVGLTGGRTGPLVAALAGGAIGFALLFLIHAVQPAGMGFGDVKLAALCGLALGWSGIERVPLGLFAAFFAGAVVGVAALASGRATRRTRIPFGPFLCVASLAVALYGDPLVSVFRATLWRS